MTKHTPGPWEVVKDTVSGQVGYTLKIKAFEADGSVCYPALINGDPDFDPQPLANARLIAAAPQLLTALQALMGTCCHKVEWERKWPNVVKTCYDAVAKATP